MSLDETSERIVVSALKTFLKQGVMRASLTDVAYEAGVTRITVYRHFGDKQGIVEAVCRHVAGIFRRAAAGRPDDLTAQIDLRLKRLGEELASLPPGNLLARLRRDSPLVPGCIRGVPSSSREARWTRSSSRPCPRPRGSTRFAQGSIFKSQRRCSELASWD